jgi:serine protease Do
MHSLGARHAALIVLLAAAGGAEPQARGEYNRRTPIVEAVEKTRAGIVTIKTEKRDAWGRKEIVGTGVVVDERGYVVTNRHVVAAAEQLTVHLDDGTRLEAEVLAEDAAHDLAVLRVRARNPLQALPLGPAGDVLVGETVIAVGSPFGYSNTVSTGIVSAVGRRITLPGGDVLGNVIQTNASINPGNSGGPLLNINGEVIGINVAVRDGAQGIAFALSADMVAQVLSRQLSAARVAGVCHGLTCRELVAPGGESRQRLVVEAGSGEELVAHKGDEVLRVGGQAVTNRFDLERALWEHRPGDQVEIAVRRQGKEIVLALTLSPAPHAEPRADGNTTRDR